MAPCHQRHHHSDGKKSNSSRAHVRFVSAGERKVLLLVLSISLLLVSAAADTFLVRVSRFLDQEVLDACNESILLSDEDGDGSLDSSEFATLVMTLSDGAISADEIAGLPLRLRTVYYLTACLCAIQPGAESDCCVGDNSQIPIDEVSSENSTVANRIFCGEVARGIADVKEDLGVTPSPTIPTSSPAPANSVSPSIAPTNVPSQVLPSVAPSQSEFEHT